MVSKTFGLLGGAAVLAGLAVSMPASAQRNPFMPSAGPSAADVERIVDGRLKALEERVLKAAKAAAPAPSTPSTAIPGSPTTGSPGSPIPGAPGPLTPGASAPGTIAPYGSPNGGPIVSGPAVPMGAVAEARAADVRFIGCINGAPKFMRKTTGERVVFTTRELNDAVKAGILPACR